MKTKLAIIFSACVLTGCALRPADKPVSGTARPSEIVNKINEKAETTPDATSTAMTLAGYQEALAKRIVEVNSIKVYVGRPQALLRAVIVLKYTVDANGKLLHSEILRTNRDNAVEGTALASLKNTAPFPKPAPHLLHHGRVEITESWLFNSDGRFQLRSIAQPQIGN